VNVDVGVAVEVGVAVGTPAGVFVTVEVGVGVEVCFSGVFVGVGPPTTVKQAENSEVGPCGPMTPWTDFVPRPRDGLFVIGGGGRLVAVAVTTSPMETTVGTVTEKVASPVAFVLTVSGTAAPRNVRPSPVPDGSQAAF